MGGFAPKSFDTIKPRKFMSRMGKTDGVREKRGHEFNFDIFLEVENKNQIKETKASKKLLTKIRKELKARNDLSFFFNILSMVFAIIILYLLYYFIFEMK